MPPKGRTITNVTEQDFELWRSAIEGQVWLNHFDRHGDWEAFCVPAKREFRILPKERQMNQEMVAEVAMDPFTNGMLVPVELVETAEDYEELKSNPNHLTASDMEHLLDNPQDILGLREGLAKVTNRTTLQRLLAIAEDPEADTTLKQLKAIKDRIEEVSKQADYSEVETVGLVTSSEGNTALGTRAPDSPAPMNPGTGRRSERL